MTLARRLASGTVQLTLSNGVVRLLSIVTMPIMTTLLSPNTYGVAALLGTLVSLVSVFALAGIDVTYARSCLSRQPSTTRVEFFCWRFAILASLIAAVLAAFIWWIIAKDSVELDRILAIVLALGIVLSVANTMAQTRARLASRYRAMALTIIAGGVIGSGVSVGIAVWWRQDAMALLLPMLLAYLVPVLLLGTPSIFGLMKPSGLKRGEGAALVKIGLAAIVTAPMYWLLSSSDRWFLQYYHGSESVGVYSIGYTVAIVGMMVNSAVMSVWLPEASREYEQDKERAKATLGRLMSRLIAAMAVIWLVADAAGGDVVRLLANERFHASAEFVPYIAGGVFFYGMSQLALTGLILEKQFKWGALWWLFGGLICILFNFALVPRYAGLGAALTQCVSFAFISLVIVTTSQAKYCMQLNWRRLATVLAVILSAGVLLAPSWHASAAISLLLKFPLGVAVATMAAWMMAPDWVARAVKHLLRVGTA